MSHHNLVPIQEQISIPVSKYAIVDGKEVSFDLKSWNGRYVVVIFLTRADHPVSEEMVKLFSDALPRFSEANCRVIGVCSDTTFALFDWLDNKKSFQNVKKFLPIISDRNNRVAQAFGALHIGERREVTNAVFVLDTEQK